MKFCVRCGKENQDDSNYCAYCGNEFTLLPYKVNDEDRSMYYNDVELLERDRQLIELQKRQLALQKKHMDKIAKCPRCGSTSLSGNKKGYGIGKGIIGMGLIGPIGLVAGNAGRKKIIVTCMHCGYKFKR